MQTGESTRLGMPEATLASVFLCRPLNAKQIPHPVRLAPRSVRRYFTSTLLKRTCPPMFVAERSSNLTRLFPMLFAPSYLDRSLL
jgi:hypothetical protein